MIFYYLHARPASHPFPIVAWLIMIFQGMAPWRRDSSSHRALAYSCCRIGELRVVDSTGSEGVQDRSYSEWSEQYRAVRKVTYATNKIDRLRFQEWIQEIEGLRYDHRQIWGLLAKQLLGFVTFNSFGKNFRALTCNEVVLSFLLHFGLVSESDIGDPDNWDLVMTDNLLNRVITGGQR